MSLNKPHSQKTLLKALHWLERQPGNWSEHIKDSQVAVKMYLKAQNTKERDFSGWAKELAPFMAKEAEGGSPDLEKTASEAVFAKNHSPKLPLSKDSKSSPPADLSDLLPKKKEAASLSSRNNLRMDDLSRKTLEQTKKDLNLQGEEEALRLLIQLGRKALQKILS